MTQPSSCRVLLVKRETFTIERGIPSTAKDNESRILGACLAESQSYLRNQVYGPTDRACTVCAEHTQVHTNAEFDFESLHTRRA